MIANIADARKRLLRACVLTLLFALLALSPVVAQCPLAAHLAARSSGIALASAAVGRMMPQMPGPNK